MCIRDRLKTEWIKPGALVMPYGTMSAVELSLTDIMSKVVVDDWGQCRKGLPLSLIHIWGMQLHGSGFLAAAGGGSAARDDHRADILAANGRRAAGNASVRIQVVICADADRARMPASIRPFPGVPMRAFRSLACAALLLAATASHAETVALRAQSATAGIEPQTKMRFVDVVLQPESRQVLADFTRDRVGKRVQLRANGVLLSSATLQSPLEGDSFRIVSGEHGFAGKSAEDIAKAVSYTHLDVYKRQAA